MTPEQEQKLNEVYAFIQSLKNSADIPFEVEQALRDRLGVDFDGSETTASQISQSVNEAGAGTYSVAKAPTGTIRLNGHIVATYD